jgi:hypothetical protein
MIRVLLSTSGSAYGYDVTGYENQKSESGWYDNLLTEDLLERVGQGDILIYFDDAASAEEWCSTNDYEFQLVEDEVDSD